MGAFEDELRDLMASQDAARMPSPRSPEPFPRDPAPLANAGFAGSSAPDPSSIAGLMHPDPDAARAGLLPKPAIAPVISPDVTAAQAEQFRNAERDDRAGMRVAAINAYDRRQSGEAPPAPPPPGAPVMARPPAAPAPAPARTGFLGGAGGSPMNPYLNELRSGYADQQRAIQAQADAEKGINAATARGAQLRRVDSENYQEGERVAAQRDAGDVTRQQREADETSRHLEKAAADPDRWWRSQGTADKVRYTVAAALGGFLQGFRGGPNVALEQINRHVDRDIASQRDAIESGRGRLRDQKDAIGEARKNSATGIEARAREHAAGLEAANAMAQQMAAESNDPLVQAKADELKAQIREKQAQLLKPVGGSGGITPKEIAEKAFEVMKLDAANGVSTTPEEARMKAIAVLTGARGAGGLVPKAPAGGEINVGAEPTSVAWHPERLLQGTDAQHALLQQHQYNADVMGYAHKAYGARTPEAQKEIMAGYIVEPGDSQETIRRKHMAFAAKAARGVPSAPPGDPPGFVEEGER